MFRGFARITTIVAVGFAVALAYMAGRHEGETGERLERFFGAEATASIPHPEGTKWSPTKPYPDHEVYFPGTEELGPDEMRVIACGTGMPMPRLKQAAACFLIELGNGDKLIFDVGTGSFTTLYALGRWTT